MKRTAALLVLLGHLVGAWSPLTAQAGTCAKPTVSDSAFRCALETIHEDDFRSKLDALAHDSTRGRETPSPELARATDWVARQFEHAGLQPGGDAGTYLQRFQLRNTQLDSLTTVSAVGGGLATTWRLGRDIVYVVGGRPAELHTAPLVLLAGIPSDTLRPFGDVSVRGSVILHVIRPDQASGDLLNPLHIRAQRDGALAHIVATEVPGEQWMEFVAHSFPEQWGIADRADHNADQRLTVFGLRLDAARDLLHATGTDPAVLMTSAGEGIRPLDGFTITVTPHYTQLTRATVANVIGILVGSDSILRREAVVFTSHMDHVGVLGGRCRPSAALPADSICNGTDDNASGTVGVIELAEAYATLERPPARTLIFAAMTAEERGLFGSRFYVDHPVIALDHTTAVINLDMIVRHPPDTVGLVGKDFTSLGALLDQVLTDHPQLELVAAERRGRYSGSDHYPFAQRGVAALFFFSGEHEDLHTVRDNPDRANVQQAVRIVRAAFLAGLEAANARVWPAWDPDARKRIIDR